MLSIIKEMNKNKEIYGEEYISLLRVIINLTLKKKLTEEEYKNISKKLKRGNDDMLAVLDMIERENKMLIKKGERRGKIIGFEEGKRKIAEKMLKEKVDKNFISKMTGLSIEEIEKLK